MDVRDITRRLGAVPAAVLSILLIIVGILVITEPVLLVWLAGLALILAGVAMIAGVFSAGRTGA